MSAKKSYVEKPKKAKKTQSHEDTIYATSSADELRMDELYEFYNEENFSILLSFITDKKNPIIDKEISLSLIEFFIVTYSNDHEVEYDVNGKNFRVHLEYNLIMKSVNKCLFDPFCRNKHIPFYFNDDKNYITTSICQLNFFKWFIENKCLDYMLANHEDIDREMKEKSKKSRLKKKNKSDTKTTSSSRSRSTKISGMKLVDSLTESFD
jgi:hypothetical protein